MSKTKLAWIGLCAELLTVAACEELVIMDDNSVIARANFLNILKI